MKVKVKKIWKRNIVILLLIVCIVFSFVARFPYFQPEIAEASNPDVTVTVTNFRDNPSKMSTGATLVDSNLSSGNTTAVANAKTLLGASTTYIKQHIMAWGALDPWPDPTQLSPTNWSSLDTQMQVINQVGGTPIITFAEAPWWMKGQLQSDGSTKLIPDD